MRLSLGLLVAALGIGVYGYQELRLSKTAKPEAQVLTCQELADKGPGDNAHVRLTRFVASTWSFVYREKRGKWTEVFVPAVPRDSAYAQEVEALLEQDPDAQIPPPKDVRVVLKLKGVTSANEVKKITDGDELTGLVINEISSLGSETKKLLSESYPGVDFAHCWILEQGRRAGSTMAAIGMLAGALVLAGFAVWLWLRKRRLAATRQS